MLLKKIHTQVFLLVLILCFVLAHPAKAQDEWQGWSENDIFYKLNDQWSIHWKPKLVFSDDFSDFSYFESVQGFKYKAHKHLDLGIYHLFALEDDDSAGGDSWEHRLRTEAVFKTKWKGLKWSDRNRYEFRTIDGVSKSRYRNRIKISKKFNVRDAKFTGYVSNEFFIDFEADEFNQNRGVIGFEKKFNDRMSAGLYYMLKSSRKGSDWNETNIIGTTVKFQL